MKLTNIISAIEEFAPRALQESWDNSGLQIGLPAEAEGECTGVLLCVDVTESVIAEAVQRGCNLVLAHHPLIFKGLRSLTGRTAPERAAAAAIRAGVAVYCAHTSLDSTKGGISYRMAEMLGAEVLAVLAPTDMKSVRLSVICPRQYASDIRLLLLQDCDLEPTAWAVDADALVTDDKASPVPTFDISHTPLTRVDVTVPQMRIAELKMRLLGTGIDFKVEETPLENRPEVYGLGVVAEFVKPVTMSELTALLHSTFGTAAIKASRAAADDSRPVRRIALCGGAGGEFIPRAMASGADAYITGDIRYHDFADHRSGMALFDIGHFESENCAKSIFMELLCKKIPNFAVQNSQTEQNPVIYL